MASKDTGEELYHEKQSYELCAIHAMNNLFQAQGLFTKEGMDAICKK